MKIEHINPNEKNYIYVDRSIRSRYKEFRTYLHQTYFLNMHQFSKNNKNVKIRSIGYIIIIRKALKIYIGISHFK